MRILMGQFFKGHGVAGTNLERVLPLIQQRIGVQDLLPQTMNVRLSEAYQEIQDALIDFGEYSGDEKLVLQRCRVLGDDAA